MALYEPAANRRQIFSQLSLFTIWLGMTGAAVWMHPDPSGHGTHTQLGLPPCPSVLLFDRPCPGCGLTTSITAFVHGDLASAFHAHFLGPFLYLGITAWALLGMYGWLKHLRLDGGGKAFDRVVGAFLAIFFVFGFARMFLSAPFASGPEIRYVIANAK